jgi:hypothetical protein
VISNFRDLLSARRHYFLGVLLLGNLVQAGAVERAERSLGAILFEIISCTRMEGCGHHPFEAALRVLGDRGLNASVTNEPVDFTRMPPPVSV